MCDNQLQLDVKKCVSEKLTTEGYTDVEYKIESGSETGDNYLGVISKVAVTAKDSKGEKHNFYWIIKTATQNDAARKLMHLQNAYFREMFMYEQVFIAYADLQKENGIIEVFNSYPILLLSRKSIPEMITMVDMKHDGYVMKNRFDAMDFEHAKLVMKEYGRLHALSFALKESKPEVFESYKKELKENYFTEFDTDALIGSNKAKTEKILESLKDDEPLLVEKFKRFASSCISTFVKLLQPEAQDDKYSVICHGDSWVNNMLFKYEDDSKIPSKLCLLDFQLSRYGSPAFDLAYFIYVCTNQELRDEHFENLLETYHASLVDFLKMFSMDGETVFPYEAVHEQMRKYAQFGIVMASMVIHLMLSDKDEVPDVTKLTEANFEEFNFISRKENIYKDRMRGVILDAIKREYIV